MAGLQAPPLDDPPGILGRGFGQRLGLRAERAGMASARWGRSRVARPWCIITATVVLCIPWVSSSCTSDYDDDKFGAYEACKDFVQDGLKSPSSAQFPDPFDDDDEILWSQDGSEWTIVSQVDAENSFGALLTVPFTCTVRQVGTDRWQLVDLDLIE